MVNVVYGKIEYASMKLLLVGGLVGIIMIIKENVLSEEFVHLPVLARESIEMLQIKPQGLYVDATFGRGGHTQLILS